MSSFDRENNFPFLKPVMGQAKENVIDRIRQIANEVNQGRLMDLIKELGDMPVDDNGCRFHVFGNIREDLNKATYIQGEENIQYPSVELGVQYSPKADNYYACDEGAPIQRRPRTSYFFSAEYNQWGEYERPAVTKVDYDQAHVKRGTQGQEYVFPSEKISGSGVSTHRNDDEIILQDLYQFVMKVAPHRAEDVAQAIDWVYDGAIDVRQNAVIGSSVQSDHSF